VGEMEKVFYKRNLPHYQPAGETFFVTMRLAGSLPIKTIIDLKQEREKALKIIEGYDNAETRREKYRLYQSKYFGKFDQLLDSAFYGPKWLSQDNIAGAVKDVLHRGNQKDYKIICYSIMSNHMHLVLTPIFDIRESNSAGYILSKILQGIKSKSALLGNKLLGRSGQFWQHESYDHVVRNEKELGRIIEYVLNNPVKAKLSESWKDWKWNYLDS
jgi:putative transposase